MLYPHCPNGIDLDFPMTHPNDVSDDNASDSEEEEIFLHCDSAEELSSDDESDMPLSERWKNFKKSFDWKEDVTFTPQVHEFTDAKAGIQVDLGFDESLLLNVTPIQLFEFFYSQDITSMICDQTNIYYEECKEKEETAGKLKPKSRMQKWELLSHEELFVFFGLSILMGVIQKPNVSMYWSTDPLLATPCFNEKMSRNRFQSISRFLHFSNEDFDDDKLKKIRPLYESMTEKFQSLYRPKEKISIDESLLKFKGRLSFRQCNLSKRARFGIKIYKTCCAENGYVYGASIYVGKTSETDDKFVGVSGKTAIKMLGDLSGQGRTVFLDNWYTSPTLFQSLHAKKNNAIGTVRLNRKHMPKLNKTDLKAIKKKQVKTYSSEKMMVMLWRDKKLVTMLSTSANANMIDLKQKNRKTGEDIFKPQCVVEYNENMGGVDRSDQMISPYEITRKSRRWYKKLASNLMDMAIFNCHTIYNALNEKKLNMLDFKITLAREILEKYSTKKEVVESDEDRDSEETLEGNQDKHYIERIENKKRLRCRECKKQSIRIDTSWCCVKCEKMPLCKNCHKTYHQQKNISYKL